MTRDDIIHMAVKCQLINAGNRDGLYMDALARFASLVAAEESEAIAEMVSNCNQRATPKGIAAAIRARGQV